MGWKNIKEEFAISHIVHVRYGNIYIGSPYISEIIEISGGKITKGDKNHQNDNLNRYVVELKEAEKSGRLKQLIDSEDSFSELKPIFTVEKGFVVKKWCEEYEWPNVCTDGELIYSNTFFKTRKEAVDYAYSSAKRLLPYRIDMLRERLKESYRVIVRDLKYLGRGMAELVVTFLQYKIQKILGK